MNSGNVFEAIYIGKAFLINQSITYAIKNVGFVNMTLLTLMSWQLLNFIFSLRDFNLSHSKKNDFFIKKAGKLIISFYITFAILGNSTSVFVSDYTSKEWKNNRIFNTSEAFVENGDYKISTALAYLIKFFSAIESSTIQGIDSIFGAKDNYTKESMTTLRFVFNSAMSRINDADLRVMVREYYNYCVVPTINSGAEFKDLSLSTAHMSSETKQIFKKFFLPNGASCSNTRLLIDRELIKYVTKNNSKLQGKNIGYITASDNYAKASYLNNEFKQITNENILEEEVEMEGTSKVFVQYLYKFGVMKIFGASSASKAASAAQDASSFIKIMPHVRGCAMIFAIGLFPMIVFCIAYSGLKYVSSYLTILVSVFAINPIWSFLYQLTMSTLTGLLKNISKITANDGLTTIMMDTIQTQSSRAYFVMFSLMVMIYAFIGYLIAQSLLQKISSMDLSEHTPDSVNAATGVAKKMGTSFIL